MIPGNWFSAIANNWSFYRKICDAVLLREFCILYSAAHNIWKFFELKSISIALCDYSNKINAVSPKLFYCIFYFSINSVTQSLFSNYGLYEHIIINIVKPCILIILTYNSKISLNRSQAKSKFCRSCDCNK